MLLLRRAGGDDSCGDDARMGVGGELAIVEDNGWTEAVVEDLDVRVGLWRELAVKDGFCGRWHDVAGGERWW